LACCTVDAFRAWADACLAFAVCGVIVVIIGAFCFAYSRFKHLAFYAGKAIITVWPVTGETKIRAILALISISICIGVYCAVVYTLILIYFFA